MALGLPELMLSDAEARDLADAITIVSKEYGIRITGKSAATFNLLMTAIVIYAPKALAIKLRADTASKNRAAESAEIIPAQMPSATAAAANFAGFKPGEVAKPDWAK